MRTKGSGSESDAEGETDEENMRPMGNTPGTQLQEELRDHIEAEPWGGHSAHVRD
jgi:hypothetical protein